MGPITCSTSIIDFQEIQRISTSISAINGKVESLGVELEVFRPKSGRTITNFTTGDAGFLPLKVRDISITLTAIQRIKEAVEDQINQLNQATKGYEATFQKEINSVHEFANEIKKVCDLYSEMHREIKTSVRLPFSA